MKPSHDELTAVLQEIHTAVEAMYWDAYDRGETINENTGEMPDDWRQVKAINDKIAKRLYGSDS